jgi:hypothetical protein
MLDHPADEMEADRVSDYVNNARHKGPECLAGPVPLSDRAGKTAPDELKLFAGRPAAARHAPHDRQRQAME